MPLEMSFLVSLTMKNQYFYQYNFWKMLIIIYYVSEGFLSSKLILLPSPSERCIMTIY